MQPTAPPGTPVAELLAADSRPVPGRLDERSFWDLGTADIDRARYFSHEWHDREVSHLWRKVWQMVCREDEIANGGDFVVHDIADDSLIVIRGNDGQVRAFPNSCLHRGTRLLDGCGHANALRCPFHGMTWSASGELKVLPSSWDFPHVDEEQFCLPQAQVAVWQGAVFVNLDPAAAPLIDYLETLPELFEGIDLAARYTAAHVRKVLPCNWKTAMEAFTESYHVMATHPQGLLTTGDENSVYDTWPGVLHASRSITPAGVPSPRLGDRYDQAKMLEQMQRLEGGAVPDIAEATGETVRSVIAARRRAFYEEKYDADLSTISDAEILDAIWYTVFPNFVPWIGVGQPIHYLFRPNDHDPDTSVMDVWMLAPCPRSGERPAAAALHELAMDDPWSDAPELGVYRGVFAQDQANFAKVQRGMKAGWKGNTLAVYQESRLRHFHHTLDHYLNESRDPTSSG